MASILKVDTIQDQSGNNIINESADTITIGASGDTISIPSGATFDASNATVTIPAVNLTTGVTGTLPVANGGTNLTSGFANGITMADQWRLSADTNQGTDGDVTTNWERPDNTGYGRIGTGLTESSGIFSFSQTGVYLINHFASMAVEDGDLNAEMRLLITTDNSSYAEASAPTSGNRGSADVNMSQSAQFLFDVTNISTHKFKFDTSSFSTTTRLRGDTTVNETHFTVLRLGDT